MTAAPTTPDFTLTADLLDASWRVEWGDSLELMAAMKSGSVDAVVTDPPYMVGAISTAIFWYRAWMTECWRVLKDGGYMAIFTNWRSLPMLMKACADAKIKTSSLAVWNKKMLGTSYEMILFCGKGDAKIDNRSQPDYFEHQWMSHFGDSGHAAQKPVPLLKQIIELVTKPGETVMDCFMGSGTTGIAAMQAGRRFVGYEGDAEHFKTAKERIHDAAEPMRALAAPSNKD